MVRAIGAFCNSAAGTESQTTPCRFENVSIQFGWRPERFSSSTREHPHTPPIFDQTVPRIQCGLCGYSKPFDCTVGDIHTLKFYKYLIEPAVPRHQGHEFPCTRQR